MLYPGRKARVNHPDQEHDARNPSLNNKSHLSPIRKVNCQSHWQTGLHDPFTGRHCHEQKLR